MGVEAMMVQATESAAQGALGLTAAAPPKSKYRLLAELGRGGMATAYLAASQGPGGFNKLVVIKRLHPSHAAEPEFLEMFLAEAKLAARIEHPNVVHTTEIDYDGENYFIAMEYIEGQALETVWRKALSRKEMSDPLPLRIYLRVLTQVLAGLHHAHELRDFDGTPLALVHRDISPHNVMVTYEGNVKIVDFGIAKAANSVGATTTGVVKGKTQYMPPEQFEGKHVDRRADVFAVGVMLWQALTRRRLWARMSDAEIYGALLSGNLASPKTVAPDVSPELEAICMRALALKQGDRYATAADFQDALEGAIANDPALRASSREVGAFVEGLFGEAREKLRAVVDAGLRAAPSASTLATSEPMLAVLPHVSLDLSSGVSTTARPSSKRPVVAAGLVALLALASAGALWVRSQRAPAMTNVTVHADPPDARVFLDDVRLTGNPPSGSFRRDGASHPLRVEAPGYVARTEPARLDSANVRIDLALDRVPVVAATTTTPLPSLSVPATAPAGTSDASSSGVKTTAKNAPAAPTRFTAPSKPTASTTVVEPPPPVPPAATPAAPATSNVPGLRRRAHIDKDDPISNP